jgi:RNA 2',3'-cyclic 3'-phosphodiesterase
MRLFIAIDFPEEIKQSINNEILSLKKALPDLKWVNKSSFHLTLKYLGETDSSLQRKIESTLKDAFQLVPTFDLTTTTPNFFPNNKKARIYYLGLEYSKTLEKCYNIIEDKLSDLGIEKEQRKFSPHITLARIKNYLFEPEKQKAMLTQVFKEIKIPVMDITLMQSKSTSIGVKYIPLQTFSLQ